MSYHEADEADCVNQSGSVELIIKPKDHDIGDLTVRRVLPSPDRQLIGPFIFFDHMGPAVLPPGKGIQVRAHPHIGIATVTYLFEGEVMHRDNLGYTQAILPGAVNLMTAGKGIVHSERPGSDLDETSRVHGIQLWIALPDEKEEMEPAFVHTPADALPQVEIDGVTIRIIMGTAYGQSAPVATYSPTLYLECVMPKGKTVQLPDGVDELAAYVVSGEVEIDGSVYEDGVMAIACAGGSLRINAIEDSRVMIIGGRTGGRTAPLVEFCLELEGTNRASEDRLEGSKVLVKWWAKRNSYRCLNELQYLVA